MGDIVDLHLARLEDNFEFISDLCRFAENILSEQQVRKKWRLADDVYEALGSNDALIEKIEAEKVRRVRDGYAKRERAQLLVTKAPDVVAGIMMDDSANARHRIDSAKVLNDFAANGPAAAPAGDRFIISIVLNGDVETYNKSIEVNPNDIDTGTMAAIAAKKKDDGSGEPV